MFDSLNRQAASFVPPGAFDAHAHFYESREVPSIPLPAWGSDGVVALEAYRRNLSLWLGDRVPTAGLFFGFPKRGNDVASANRLIHEALRDEPNSRGLMLVTPACDPAAAATEVSDPTWAGFKVYHLYAAREDTFNAEPGEFIPEWAWEIADARELAITLHLVRERALADPLNQVYIVERCRRYGRAKLILAHAARGFCGWHTVEGIESLRGLDNVYFDTSAICEPVAFEAILKTFGPTQLLFGTDFPVSEIIGRCVSVGDGFHWMSETELAREKSPFAKPVRVGVESVLALRQACRSLCLNDRDVERIFFANARQLLGIDKAAPKANQEAYRRARQVIPGGTQLLSKRPEMFAPGRWPAYFREARGCEVIDLDERRFVDFSTSGIGTCLLGYADPDVTDAVIRRVQLGAMCTLNSPEEYELARLLIEIHPWAEQVRYCRTGGEAMAVAVRIARAATKRDAIAFCGYHGWSDWYLAANLTEQSSDSHDRLREHLLPGLEPAGVPGGLFGTALPFGYNKIDELRRHVREHRSQIAAVVMEPTRSEDPAPGFLDDVRQICDDCGAALVFDEITTGWRMHHGGAHLKYGASPDMAVFAKAIGNGHPMAAIIGKTKFMQAAQESFISSTYWTEAVGPTAALAAIRKMRTSDVVSHVNAIGSRFRSEWEQLGHRHGLAAKATGHASLLHLGFAHPEPAALGTLFTTRMLDRGFLAGSGFYPSLAHSGEHLEGFTEAADEVFAELAIAVERGDVLDRLEGEVRHSGFRRLN